MPYCNSNCSLTAFCIKEYDDDDDDDCWPIAWLPEHDMSLCSAACQPCHSALYGSGGESSRRVSS